MKFRLQPSMYCPDGEFYLICSIRNSNIETLKEVLLATLAAAERGDYKKFEWDSLIGTVYPDEEPHE